MKHYDIYIWENWFFKNKPIYIEKFQETAVFWFYYFVSLCVASTAYVNLKQDAWVQDVYAMRTMFAVYVTDLDAILRQ